MTRRTATARCPYCGSQGTIRSRRQTIRAKRKVGLGWMLAFIFTAGAAIPVYMLSHPTGKKQGTDRWIECSACGTSWT